MLASPLGRAPQPAAPGKGGRDQALGRARGGLPTTRPLAGDPLGRPLRVLRSPGPAGAAPRALLWRAGVRPRHVLAAAADDLPALRTRIAAIKAEAVLPCPPRRKRLLGSDAAIDQPRTRLARSFHTINPCRRLATRDDRTAL